MLAAKHFQTNYINSNITSQWSFTGIALIQHENYTSCPIGAMPVYAHERTYTNKSLLAAAVSFG